MPSDSCWPKSEEWNRLAKKLTGSLIKPVSIIEPCKIKPDSPACKKILNYLYDPFLLEQNSGDTQSQGWVNGDEAWLNAWQYANSVYAIEAENKQDIVEGVKFASKHNLRLVIKSTGHDYLGRSNAPDSLLIWTHKMRHIKVHDHFRPHGCLKHLETVPAVTVEAGARWLEVYHEVTNRHNRFVLGGGCASVGAAGGFIMGGGYGSLSKKFGTGAGNVLEAELITADGQVIVANQCQNQDLFWAIRGGGGGTFGIVSKLTLKTHPLPSYLGIVLSDIKAKNDQAFEKLIQKFLQFAYQHLNNEHWGEQVQFKKDNSINILITFQGKDEKIAKMTWQPFLVWLKRHDSDFTFNFKIWSVPPRQFWDEQYWDKVHPEFITRTKAKDSKGNYWWSPNTNEVYNYWYTLQSWWIPAKLFKKKNSSYFATLIFNATRIDNLSFQFSKGLSNSAPYVLNNRENLSVNPAVYDAVGLLLMAAGSNHVYPGIRGHEPNYEEAKLIAKHISQIMESFRRAASDSGTYINESDYFQKNWQQAYWGKNYQRLLKIKQLYDPNGLFYCHHCVGSELWREKGFCRIF